MSNESSDGDEPNLSSKKDVRYASKDFDYYQSMGIKQGRGRPRKRPRLDTNDIDENPPVY